MQLTVLFAVLFVARGLQAAPPATGQELIPLRFVARLPAGAARESSGIVQSRSNSELFWTHNDSGDEPRLYPLRRNGAPFAALKKERKPGVLIQAATNIDWEDIAALDDGTLVIADLGNNANHRQDLALYLVPEPAPDVGQSARAVKIAVRYPDQSAFPPPPSQCNFDCEAIFTVGDRIHALTKHRGDARTKLYRLDDPRPDRVNTFKLLGETEIGGMVVAADCDRAGKRLLILTMQSVWLFERDDVETSFFEGRVSTARYFLPQAEAICFADAETALLTDEILDALFEVKLSSLHAVSR